MNSFITRIAQLFSSAPVEQMEKSVENLDELTAYYEVHRFDKDLPAVLNLDGLNGRDVLTIGLFDAVGDTASEERVFRSDAMGEWNAFEQYYSGIDKDEPIKIKLSITKRKVNRVRSVYCPDLFAKYLESLGLKEVIDLFDGIQQDGALCVEYQEEGISLVGPSMAFVSNGHSPVYPSKPVLNEDVIEQGKYLCCNDLIKNHLRPTDFELRGTDNAEHPIMPLIQKAALLYSLCFLFDYVTLTGNQLHYKLNGYKTLTGIINVESVYSAEIDSDSWCRYLEIFKWQYNGGNLTDKSAIARNIVSLNMVEDGTLALREGTLDAIDSNYRIYEKENVRQYIEIRNNVAKQLRDYQKYIIGIFDEFEQDFKKMFFSFLGFAFTTTIIRVLAKNIEDKVILPDTIVLLLLGYCAVSCFYYAYARWKRDKKVDLFDKQYNATRTFYKDLLSDKELSELFTDERNKDGTYKAFIEERTYRFDWIWVVANLIFAAILIYIKCRVNVNI